MRTAQIQVLEKGLSQALKPLVGRASTLTLPNGAGPRGIQWKLLAGGELSGRIPTEAIEGDLQDTTAAAPSYAFAFIYWLRRMNLLLDAHASLEVVGPITTKKALARQRRRGLFLADQLQSAVPNVFSLTADRDPWCWPDDPHLNEEAADRAVARDSSLSEHDLEVQLSLNGALTNSFRQLVKSFHGFQRQLPIGLFEGPKSQDGRWLPGGKAGVDLWGTDDDKTFHAFELKKGGANGFGIFPEVVAYGRLLHYVRRGLPTGNVIQSGGKSIDKLQQSERVIVWLIAERFHPLVLSHGDSPLAWLNHAWRPEGLEFRILPFSMDSGGIKAWRFPELWNGTQLRP